MRGDILSVATIFHQTGGPSYPAPEQKLPSHGALQVPEMLLLLKSPLNYGKTLKKKYQKWYSIDALGAIYWPLFRGLYSSLFREKPTAKTPILS